MMSYTKQVAICNPVRESIKQTITQSKDVRVRAKITDIPTTETILRAVSLLPHIDTEEALRDFATKHILDSLRMTQLNENMLT